MSRLGLRARLAVALVAVAVLAVAIAALIGNLGLDPRLNDAARTRLASSATHVATISAAVYEQAGGWTAAATTELTHLAALDGLRVALVLSSGQTVEPGPQPTGATARAPVVVRGQTVATVVVSTASGALLTPEEEQLGVSLDQLHLVAAGVAALAALLVGLVLAQSLSGPLRRIRSAAERLERGELEARVEVGAEPETRAVGRALNRLAETLEHEEESRKESVADLAHELRTPVNGLLVRVEAAQDGLLALPENLAAMHEEALRLTRLLDDLASLADAERPGLLLDMQPLDLAEAANTVARSFAPRFAEAGIGFATVAQAAWVSGNQGRLEQVVSNLLSNALRYTEAKGEVSLRVATSGDQAVLEVVDTGIGIAPDDLRHIFTRFWRGDRSRSRATGGTGIGLAIVRALVRAHDGRIDVDSTTGRGSRFRVVLPALIPDVVAAPIRAPETRSAPSAGAKG
ncbi:MAG: sensor histidine kinase [Candidatus Dormibacteria bacterium]